MANTADTVLEQYEKTYRFSRGDNIVYFLTYDKYSNNDEEIKIKLGMSRGGFNRRWSSYCSHATDWPTLIAVISLPPILSDRLENEEARAKGYFKDRTYMGRSKEKIKATINEVCDYFETRQKNLNELAEEQYAKDIWDSLHEGFLPPEEDRNFV